MERTHLSVTLRTRFIWGLLSMLFMAGAMAATPAHGVPESLLGLHEFLSANPLLAPFLFILLYALAVMAFLPGALLCLLGGALFGPWLGGILNVAGATLGASLAFLAARHLAASQIEHHMSKTLQRLKHGVEQEGWRFVAMIRLLPLVPYDISSYAFGLCRIPLRQFAVTNAICLLPRLTVYAYIGHRGAELIGEEGDQLLNLVSLLTLFIAIVLLPQLYLKLRHPQ